ncbi:phage protease [Tahibacter soli]|uniref:Phage protease n=1 Tax=Tahibacter soli TaxID=2983605 RepID=A0A9X3YLJ5_9GAMM|nr:phage protease [Tahibacter soli]MDC8012933.1 phage protease [Tahibacter soli]
MTPGIAIAACAFALPTLGDSPLVAIQLTPAGSFRPRDGREMSVDAWHIDAAKAARVIAAFQQLATPPVLDYEHQTLLAEENGQPAPAAGWFRNLVWREGEGLFGDVELTARARQYIADGEYRYFSPVIRYDPKTGDVLAFVMGALTNNPAIDGMQAVALRAAASFRLQPPKETPMDKLLAAVIAALSLHANATEDEAATALKAKHVPADRVRTALGLGADADGEAVVAACTSLRQKANATKPDPAEYVPRAAVDELRTEIASLKSENTERDVDALVKDALTDGRLLPALESWARDLGKSDVAQLRAYLKTAQPIAALSGTQTRGIAPNADPNAHGLNADELAICRAAGIAPADFAKNRRA